MQNAPKIIPTRRQRPRRAKLCPGVEVFSPDALLRIIQLDDRAACGEFELTLEDARGREIGSLTVPADSKGRFIEPTWGQIAALFWEAPVRGPAFLYVRSAHSLH